jgi:hypothetical protein
VIEQIEQLQLGEFTFPRNVLQVLHLIRTKGELLSHDDQRVFVRWAPRPQDGTDSNTQSAPWRK